MCHNGGMSGDNLNKDKLPFLFAPAIDSDQALLSKNSEFLVEGYESSQAAAMLSNERFLHNLNDVTKKSIIMLVSFAVGGYAQWEGEIDKVLGAIRNESPGKFAGGMADFNAIEEIVEGGVPSVVGAGIALFALRYYGAKKHREFTSREEMEIMIAGAVCGYMSMAIGGAFVHKLLDVSDFPTLDIITDLVK